MKCDADVMTGNQTGGMIECVFCAAGNLCTVCSTDGYGIGSAGKNFTGNSKRNIVFFQSVRVFSADGKNRNSVEGFSIKIALVSDGYTGSGSCTTFEIAGDGGKIQFQNFISGFFDIYAL